MMITRLNFPYLFPQILTTIQSSNFISLDLEMSGIISTKTLDPSLTDTIQNRYHKTREKVKTFIPLQLGLCAVKIQNNRVIYTPMNFYLYPLSLEERDAQQFSFNSESMRFLSQNHFDFNKLFYEGIPFTNSAKLQKNEIKTSLLKAEQQKTKQYMLQSPDISAFITLKMNEFSNWISSQQNEDKDLLIDIQFVRVKAYLYLIQKIVQKYPSISINFSFIDSQGNQVQNGNFLTRKYLKIKRVSNQIKSEDSQNPSKIKLQNSPQSLLFLKLWQTIISKQVPLVVHNGFLDLMHIYHRFIDNLPLEQSQFRKSFHAKFPIIYDTKYMCNNSPLIYNKLNRDTSLGNCYKKFLQAREETKAKQQHIGSQLNCEFSGYKFDSQEAHEAGFDALMTAYVFVQAFKQLYYSPLKMIQPNFHKAVQFYCNKVPLGNIRLPFNFTSENESYEKDGGTQIFFTCLQRPTNETVPLLIKQQKITGYLLQKYGATRLIWQDRYLSNFVITFIDEKDGVNFIQDNLDNSGFGLCNKLLIKMNQEIQGNIWFRVRVCLLKLVRPARNEIQMMLLFLLIVLSLAIGFQLFNSVQYYYIPPNYQYLQMLSMQPSQQQSEKKLEEAHRGYAYQLLHLQMAVQDEKLSIQPSINEITQLIQLYMIGVQVLESIADPRFVYFHNKIHSLMLKKHIAKKLHQVSNTKESRIETKEVMKSKKDQYEVNCYFNQGQVDLKRVKQMLNIAENKKIQVQGKISQDIQKQQDRLQERIKQRRMRSEAGSVKKFKLGSEKDVQSPGARKEIYKDPRMEYFDKNDQKLIDLIPKGKVGRMGSGSLQKSIIDKKNMIRRPPQPLNNKNTSDAI